jgi:K+-sensing histidine kinase KdpD
MIFIGGFFLKNPSQTNKWFDLGILVPAFFLNVSLAFVGYYHPGHTLNAVSGMLMVLAMITYNQKIPSWVLKFVYVSYSIIVLYNIRHEDEHFKLLAIDPSKFYLQQYLNYVFFSASMAFMIQVALAKDTEYKTVKKSYDDIKEYDINFLNALLHNIKAPSKILIAKIKMAALSKSPQIALSEIDASSQLLETQLIRIEEFSKIINSTNELSLDEISNRISKGRIPSYKLEIIGDKDYVLPWSVVFALDSFIENSFTFATISKLRIHQNQEKITITLEDKGPGIIPEVFNKLGSEIISKPDSYGIGLMLSKYIIKRQDWSLVLATKFNEGSVIELKNHRSDTLLPENFDLFKKF